MFPFSQKILIQASFAFQLDVRWNMIACGKTRPTLDLTEQARQYLSTMKPRSLDLWRRNYSEDLPYFNAEKKNSKWAYEGKKSEEKWGSFFYKTEGLLQRWVNLHSRVYNDNLEVKNRKN